MGQPSYTQNITTKRAGAAVDYQALNVGDVQTGRNELATVIKPGFFVAQGATDDDVMIDDSGATGAVLLGVAVDNENRERTPGSTGTAGYIQNELVPYATTGRRYVNCGSAAAKGGTVYVRFVAGTTAVIGEAYNTADAASCDAVNATFAETITAPGIVAVELNMHQV